jgi:hypothetical protein
MLPEVGAEEVLRVIKAHSAEAFSVLVGVAALVAALAGLPKPRESIHIIAPQREEQAVQ